MGYKTFKYLTAQGLGKDTADRAEGDTVELCYKRADLRKRVVIWNEYNHSYLVFDSRGEFAEWYAGVPPAERNYHEVVFGWAPQRLKFDIDAPAYKIDAIPDDLLAVDKTPTVGLDLLAELLGEDDPPDDDPLEILLGGAPTPPENNDDPLEILLGGAPPQENTDEAAPDPEAQRNAKARALVGLVLEAVLDELHDGYYGVEDLLPTRAQLAVTDSSGASGGSKKYSYHIVTVPYYVADNEESREFTARVLDRLPAPVRACVDAGVNKRVQNFRLAGSAKAGTRRYKRLVEGFGTAAGLAEAELLVTAEPGARILARVYTDGPDGPAPPRPALAPGDPAVRAALEVAAAITTNHEFTGARGTLLCFRRLAPSHCRICGETHHRDNSLLLSVEPAEGPWPATRFRVVEHCRQARGRGLACGEFELAPAEAAALAPAAPRRPPRAATEELGLAGLIAARVEALASGRADPHAPSAFERLPDAQKTVYSEPAMRAYELAPTLAVAAQMKLGKTKALRDYIAAHFPADGLEQRVVRFVTFRQTFSKSIHDAFPDFTLYNEVEGDLDHVRHPRLIVQVESLHRLRMAVNPEPVDLLVLDEVESILAQFNSGLHRHFNAAFAMFAWMMRTARHVVVMDANLGDRTFAALGRLRPAHPPRFHWNRHRRAADDVYYFTSSQADWLARLYAALRAGQRVVIPTNSLSEAKAYDEGIRREFPRLRVMLYSSETAPSEKALHFGDVHRYWGDLDVLIYTPTCSAGVSFELARFDALYGYFCDVSCDVETCRQMLGRVRNLATHEHYICLRATGAALPETVEAIRAAIYDKRAGLYRAADASALRWDYDDAGEIRHYESDYFHLWLETVRVANLSRNNFARRFIDQVADTGAEVRVLAPGEGGAELLAAHRAARGEIRARREEAVAAAEDVSPEEDAAIRDALSAQRDVAPHARLAHEKYALRDAYDWHGRPVTPAFVAAYDPADVRRVYRNLLAITEGKTTLESLQLMRARELGNYEYVMETRAQTRGYVGESRDLVRDRETYVFQAHTTAMWLLRAGGWESVLDRAHVHEALLETRYRAVLPALERAADRLVFEFEIPRPNLGRVARDACRESFIRGVLRVVNPVLRVMYGLSVRRVPKRAGGGAYALSLTPTGRLFVFSATPDHGDPPRPHIPSNLAPPDENHRVNLFLDTVWVNQDEGVPNNDFDDGGLDGEDDGDDGGDPDGGGGPDDGGDNNGRGGDGPSGGTPDLMVVDDPPGDYLSELDHFLDSAFAQL